MRNLTLLKSLIDFIWFVTCIPLIPLSLFIAFYVFYDISIVHLALEISQEFLLKNSLWVQLYTVSLVIIILAGIYCFYKFRQTLRFFQQRKPFHIHVINTYKLIGKLLIGCGVATFISSFIFRIVLTSEIKIDLGISTHLIIICLGLFFLVLSETFLVAKIAKEENDLTV